MSIVRTQMAKPTQGLLLARGIHKLHLNHAICKLVTSPAKMPAVLDEHRCCAETTGPLEYIIESERNERLNLTTEVINVF